MNAGAAAARPLFWPAAEVPEKRVTTPAEAAAADAAHLLAVQLGDGAIPRTGEAKVVVEPGGASLAAIALVTAAPSPESDQAKSARRWLEWYAAHIDPDYGTPLVHRGTRRSYTASDPPTACGTYAGLYLVAASRYLKLAGALPPAVAGAPSTSLGTFERLAHDDGTIEALPDWGVRYLIENVHVYWGLSEAAPLFEPLGRRADAAKARLLAGRLARGLARLRKGDHYGYAISNPAGIKEVNPAYGRIEDDAATQNVASSNLYAVAFFDRPLAGLWERVNSEFEADTTADADAPPESWLLAAARAGTAAEVAYWRTRVVQESGRFDEAMYVDRVAVSYLALLGEKVRWPRIPVGGP